MYRNSIILIGYLARDPETRSPQDGVPYTVFEVATKESWKNPQGEWQSRTELHRCVAWGPQLSGFVSKLTRGNHVQVEGSLRTREVDRDGIRHKIAEIRVNALLKIEAAHGSSGPVSADYEPSDSSH